MAPQPLKEEYLLTGALEPTNDAYALAKISAIKLCTAYNKQYGTNFLSVMPTNLYGPGDNYNLENSHVLPAMIRKFHEAKVSGKNEVVLWGDGSPLREFLYSEDLAQALVYLMENKNAGDLRNSAGDFINAGSGKELSIRQLAETVRAVVYESESAIATAAATATACTTATAAAAGGGGTICRISWDTTKPNGTPRKLCDISRLGSLGFSAKTGLSSGIKKAYSDFLMGQS
jgi:GDP-L-fucose synthase